ncbi:MAG: 3-oxoacyl-ACP reductase FabG [Planctomycetaceae bacterium]
MADDSPRRIALVTGGSRGIGAAICRTLARDGFDVALVHHQDATNARSVAQALGAIGRRALAIDADVADTRSAQEVVDRVEKELGALDALVCCAGVTEDAVLWKMSEEAWDRVLDVNLKGCFNYLRAAARPMRARRRGRIVAVASINGLRGKFGQANYAASKAGLLALAKTAARELGPSGITVNAVAPGMVRTAMVQGLPPSFLDQALRESVLGRIGDPEDVAELVAFLCSDRSRHITGECIRVDGGQAM